MPTIPTIPQIIELGEIATYKAFNYVADSVLWGSRTVKTPDPVMVALITDALAWEYEISPANPNLRQVANFNLWVYGFFQVQAQAASGGGTVIPINPSLTMPNPIEFVVSDTSPIVTGGNTLSLPNFIGYNIIFNRNNTSQTQINTGGQYFLWDKISGVFQCFGDAAQDELFSINAA